MKIKIQLNDDVFDVDLDLAELVVAATQLKACQEVDEEQDKEDPIPWEELTVRGRKALRRMGLQTLEQLEEKTRSEVLGTKNCGLATLHEIQEMLDQRGRSLFGRSMS